MNEKMQMQKYRLYKCKSIDYTKTFDKIRHKKCFNLYYSWIYLEYICQSQENTIAMERLNSKVGNEKDDEIIGNFELRNRNNRGKK